VFDLTDYSMFLDAERDALLDAAVAEDRAREADDRMLEDLELDMEVKIMLEMI